MRMKLLGVAALALAARGQENGRGGFVRMSPLLRALDVNRDGVISEAEILHAPEALRSLDRNGDGNLTRDEYAPNFGRGPQGRGGERGRDEGAPADASKEMVETLMAFDKNHDGKISRDELPERMQGMFDRGDLDKDGFLTAEEIGRMAAPAQPGGGQEGRGEGRGRGPGRADPVVAALDRNGDGVISADEIDQSPASLKTLDRNGDGQLTEEEVRPAFGRGGRGPA